MKALKYIAKLPEAILALLMIGITIVLFIEVITRYLLKIPLPWTDEVARLMLVWLSFLGVGVGIKTKAHVQVEALITKLPAKIQRYMRITANLSIIFFAVALLYFSFDYVRASSRMIFPVLRISFLWRALAVPVAAILIITYCGQQLLHYLNKNGKSDAA
ncbi:TRAP transporter small permease [Neomoorella mulderi]|uniref:Sialic acid TRAP transporter permease protein SiaT n=1 Tax=Moorella mulderi DSM 14980 TaxID=1122241 RepID=A0A151AW64_9FIRM|nr:TRAP transporter small permease [Moorella mulderi]KYH31790.1 sialic acid TRAP transporter permease protein SiaT [Moorella mulderi DSM 14980]